MPKKDKPKVKDYINFGEFITDRGYNYNKIAREIASKTDEVLNSMYMGLTTGNLPESNPQYETIGQRYKIGQKDPETQRTITPAKIPSTPALGQMEQRFNDLGFSQKDFMSAVSKLDPNTLDNLIGYLYFMPRKPKDQQ